MDSIKLLKITNLVSFVFGFCLFNYFMFQIGYQQTLKDICENNNSSVYYYQKHDFKTVRWANPNNKHHCLIEIPIKTCFAGQKEIIPVKCKINEQIGVNYGYIESSTKK